MIRNLLVCAYLILVGPVMAQAEFTPAELGIAKVETRSWLSTHAGEMELDGLPVVATFETVQREINIPPQLANMETLVPLHPMVKKEFRITLATQEAPALRARFKLVGRTLMIDGEARYAYVTPANTQDEFSFTIYPQEDGSLRGTYERRVHDGMTLNGVLELSPLLTTM